MSLATPTFKVEKLQKTLHEKAKAESNFRFYSLYDKICKMDVLRVAYKRCRRNGGAPGADTVDFIDIETDCLEKWLEKLQKELVNKEYCPRPLLRVWIPKANGDMRPLGIPSIKDRVVQMATVLVLSPIFEADFTDNQYGFRPGLDAKLAVRKVFFQIAKHGRPEVVDGDLKDYFNLIPHGPLLKSVARRVSDKRILSLLKMWLEAPIIERDKRTGSEKRSTPNKDGHRGTPQGGVVSPLLANIYFRRFSKYFEEQIPNKGTNAFLVNYADDFVICCATGEGPKVMDFTQRAFKALGLAINEEKTKLINMNTGGQFNFLGYRFGMEYSLKGRSYIGTRPSVKAVQKLRKRIHDETSVRWSGMSIESRIKELNPVLRGWLNYFNQGPVIKECRVIKKYTEKRLRRWLVKKHKQRGTGYRQYPDKYLYEELGLYKMPVSRADLQSAKSCHSD